MRAGNVIGGGDWSEDRIIPDCIRSLEAGKTIGVRNPRAVRPWQFVLEPLGGYLLLGAVMGTDPDRYGGPWNFGPDSSSTVTVGELTGLVVDAWGSGSWESTATGHEAHEAGLLALDISKARYTLGWRPSLTVQMRSQ